jgi:hypothetical protein
METVFPGLTLMPRFTMKEDYIIWKVASPDGQPPVREALFIFSPGVKRCPMWDSGSKF